MLKIKDLEVGDYFITKLAIEHNEGLDNTPVPVFRLVRVDGSLKNPAYLGLKHGTVMALSDELTEMIVYKLSL